MTANLLWQKRATIDEKAADYLYFCIRMEAQNLDLGVDIVFMRQTGLSILNVFALDVDSPDAEVIPITQYQDYYNCLEASNFGDASEKACEVYNEPHYLNIWQLRSEEQRSLSSLSYRFVLENLETGEVIEIFDCKTGGYCEYRLSPDARWLAIEGEDGMMLLDLSRFGEAEAFFLADAYPTQLFWLNERQILYWSKVLNHFYLYDTTTNLHYPLETVLDRNNLEINIDGVAGLETLPETSIISHFDETNLPADIRRLEQRVWRPDGTGLIYASSEYELPEPQYCDTCAVAYWDEEQKSSRLLFGLGIEAQEADEDNDAVGWFLRDMVWSADSSRFLAGFYEIGVYHQPLHYWLYDMEISELREVFAGGWAQWLH